MRLGIFDADTLSDKLQPKYHSYGHMFAVLFRQVNPQISTKFYNILEGEYPKNSNECDAYLITGSKSSAYDDTPWIIELKKQIAHYHQENIKLLGICFGHQIIALALGGNVSKATQGWGIGVHTYQFNEPFNKLNIHLPNEFSLLASHQDQVTELPKNAILLASSQFCSIAAYHIGNQVLSFQGHPEFTVDYETQLLKSREDLIPNAIYNQGVNTLIKKTNHLEIAEFMLAFAK